MAEELCEKMDMNTKNRIEEEMKRAALSRVMHLSHSFLYSFPLAIFDEKLPVGATSSMERLLRLDLSFNHIEQLPSELTRLRSLRELWLQNNPLTALPECIDACSLLEVIDIRNTKVRDLPANIAHLDKLHELDFRGTQLERMLLEEYVVEWSDLQGVKAVYQGRLDRETQNCKLRDMFSGQHFLREADRPNMKALIAKLVEVCAPAIKG